MHPTDKFLFHVSVIDNLDGRRLGPVKWDEDGYTTMPMAVINHHTENNTFYDPDDLQQQINNAKSLLNIRLSRGTLKGEADHPVVHDTTPASINRLMSINKDRESHHIKDILTKPHPNIKGAYIIFAKIKPMGMFGHLLKSELDEKYVNTSFSLRSLVNETYDNVKKLRMRKILNLVTFDWVTDPGSYEASKRWADIAMESRNNISIDPLDILNMQQQITSVGTESLLIDGDLADFIGTTALRIRDYEVSLEGVAIPNTSLVQPKNSQHTKSLLHAGLMSKGGIK